MTKDKRSDRFYLLDILDAIDHIEAFLNGKSRADFEESYLLQCAVIKQFEIIGEASSRITEHTRARGSDISWQDIIGMRHKMIHDYFEVDIDIAWNTATNDLATLKSQIAKILAELQT